MIYVITTLGTLLQNLLLFEDAAYKGMGSIFMRTVGLGWFIWIEDVVKLSIVCFLRYGYMVIHP